MKKFFALSFVLLFTIAATFAASGDKVITVENFNEEWIVGDWTIIMTASDGNETQTEEADIQIKGSTDTSAVITTDKAGTVTEETLLQIKQAFDAMQQAGEQLMAMGKLGATVTGDNNIYLNSKKTQIKWGIGVSMAGQKAELSLIMTKK